MEESAPLLRTWIVKKNPAFRHGYADGEQYPSLLLEVRGGRLPEKQKSLLWDELFRNLPQVPEEFEASFSMQGLQGDGLVAAGKFLLSCVHLAQLGASHPVFCPGRILSVNNEDLLLSIPVWPETENVIARLVVVFLEVFDQVLAGVSTRKMGAGIKRLSAELLKACSFRPSSSRFLRVAIEDGIPFHYSFGQLVFYGQGVHQRWLDLTFTDKTSRLGAIAARQKTLGARRLRASGIPVPEHYLVTTLQSAYEAAVRLGFPVVVKPADSDGGAGVTAGIFEETEIEKAFLKAQKVSRQILVEKYFEGRDYRLCVMDGVLILAIERVPASVLGDGVSTVSSLVDIANSDIRRGVGKDATLQKIELDEEALGWLARNNMNSDSIPPDGFFVRLKGAANIATGGVPVSVLDQVHPDNRLLAIRAVEAMRLDIAGVDLLIPDISRSWMETGAAICEVNAQPALGPVIAGHLYREILTRLMARSGRIPVTVVLGAQANSRELKTAVETYRRAGLCVGWSNSDGVHIDDRLIMPGPVDAYSAGHLLFQEKNVAAAVICVNETSVFQTGLPMSRYDRLVIAGNNLFDPDNENLCASKVGLDVFVKALLPACQNEVVVSSVCSIKEGTYRGLSKAAWREAV